MTHIDDSDSEKQPHLWEVEHSYYCNEGNYRARNCYTKHLTFQDFIDEEGDSDFDMNLIFRWDWREGYEEKSNFNGDIYYRNGDLLLFYMGQRKGAYRWVEISVCRADEKAVKEFLEPRFKHLMELWSPFNTRQALKSEKSQ